MHDFPKAWKQKLALSFNQADSESQVDVEQQGVVLQDPAKVALQVPFIQKF